MSAMEIPEHSDIVFEIAYPHDYYIDVFSGPNNADMRYGHHAMLKTRRTLEDTRDDGWVDAVWMLPPDIMPDHDVYGYSAWWTAHETATWLQSELFPEVCVGFTQTGISVREAGLAASRSQRLRCHP